jgi:hypothetical protein
MKEVNGLFVGITHLNKTEPIGSPGSLATHDDGFDESFVEYLDSIFQWSEGVKGKVRLYRCPPRPLTVLTKCDRMLPQNPVSTPFQVFPLLPGLHCPMGSTA